MDEHRRAIDFPRNTIDQLLYKFKKHHTQLVRYCDGDVGRLEGFGADMEDYYWIVYYPEDPHAHWCSCVGGINPIKGTVSEEEYMELERVFAEREYARRDRNISKWRAEGKSEDDIRMYEFFHGREHIHPNFIRRTNEHDQ